MTFDPQTTWIKRSPHRCVGIQETEDGQRRIVKRFQARSWPGRFRDRGRAEREFKVLRSLHGAGLDVPEPHELRRREGGWELTCELVMGARTLGEALADDGPHSTRARETAAALGRLIGRAHALGLDHGDLHAGNVLLDEQDRPWMIDFTGSVLRPELPDSVLERDLLNLAADCRESVDLRLRRRFLVEWRRTLQDQRPSLAGFVSKLTRGIEVKAVSRRRDSLIEHEDRWLRDSGLCEQVRVKGHELLVSRLLPPGYRAELDSICAPLLGPIPGDLHRCKDGIELLLDTSSRDRRRSWAHLGRATQHGIPALTPVALSLGPESRALYLVSDEARPTSTAEPAALARLLGELFDRGLCLPQEDHLWASPTGELLLGPGSELQAAQAPPHFRDLPDGEALVEAFLDSWRGEDHVRTRLRHRLLHG